MFKVKNEEEFTFSARGNYPPSGSRDGRASAEKAREMIDTAVREGSHFFEWTHQRIGGEEFPADMLLTKMERNGKVIIQATVRDITEQKQLQQKLMQSQKTEAIGRLAGGIAHEFNNLLTAILGYTSLALGRLPSDNPLRHDLEQVERAGNRATMLTRQLLSFSRKSRHAPTTTRRAATRPAGHLFGDGRPRATLVSSGGCSVAELRPRSGQARRRRRRSAERR